MMGLTSAWKAWRAGASVSDALSYAFTPEETIQRGQELDSQLERLNREAFEAGRWSQGQFEVAQAQAAQGSINAWVTNPDTGPWGGFKAGAATGAKILASETAQGALTDWVANPDASPIIGAAQDAIRDTSERVQGAIKTSLAAPFNFALGSIPWQIWAAALLYLAWHVGLLQFAWGWARGRVR